MLRTSAKVNAMDPGPGRLAARDHLYRGQSNDCYWHGLFGGIYISHMRLATYEHLIAAEDLADTSSDQHHVGEIRDLDMDGQDDVRLAGPGQVVTVELSAGAGIGSWDIRAVRHALAAVMRRRPEAYHETLRAREAELAAAAPATPAPGTNGEDGEAPASIHDIVLIKERGLSEQLHYDPYERRSGLVRFLAPGTDPETWASAKADELGDAIDGAFEIEQLELDRLVVGRTGHVRQAGTDPAEVRVTKELLLGGDRREPTLELVLTVENRSAGTLEALLGLEWTLTMLGGGGNPSAWWEVDGTRTGHDTAGSAASTAALAQGNDYVGVAVATSLSAPAAAWWAPVETISNSESGFERVYQGSGLLLSWPLALPAGETFSVRVHQAVTTSVDRSAEEASAALAPSLGR
ncbi:MAG: DUF1926 domain-containing protein [Chloroflexi bacterium]|nr:DUF1926 domain-containing protein [Chloroflexota bacterium]